MKVVLLALIPALAAAGAPDTPESAYNDAGFIDVKNGTRHLFYWMFESRNDPTSDPVMLWMSGGPGCSSQLALFGENGPLTVNDDLSLEVNPNSWSANATVVWVDQPVGTGFSYGAGRNHNEEGVENDMYEFIVGFFDKYPQYKGLDFHIFGESYAGHYVPAVASTVLARGGGINLKGAGIGNGLVDPTTQYLYYLPYAQEHGLVEPDSATEKLMKAGLAACEPLAELCNYDGNFPNFDDDVTKRTIEWTACINAYMICNLAEVTPVQSTGINPYDVRVQCGDDPLCYDFSAIDSYLNQDDVKEALGTTGHEWAECSHVVDLIMVYGGDWMVSFAERVKALLEGGVDVLVYSGEYDFIVNWLGGQAWTQALEWSGADDFAKAENKTWTVGKENAGSYVSASGFTFLKVKNAGHMVPRDVPENALSMVLSHFAREW